MVIYTHLPGINGELINKIPLMVSNIFLFAICDVSVLVKESEKTQKKDQEYIWSTICFLINSLVCSMPYCHPIYFPAKNFCINSFQYKYLYHVQYLNEEDQEIAL